LVPLLYLLKAKYIKKKSSSKNKETGQAPIEKKYEDNNKVAIKKKLKKQINIIRDKD
tara:strand:+ start:133 stop:303 length:171 start_codon:yes stop_codon:yes gene_type:complete